MKSADTYRDKPETIPIVCFAEDWGRLPSSSQHLMRGLSKTHPVLWVDSLGLRTPSAASASDLSRILSKVKRFLHGIREVEPNLFRFSPIVIPLYRYRWVRQINRRLLRFFIRRFLKRKGFGTLINWGSCPTAADTCDYLDELGSVYYVGDEFSEFTQFDAGLVGNLERRLLVRSDVLFVVSDRLRDTKSQFNPVVRRLPHGCDYEHFSTAASLSDDDVPDDMRPIKGPVIGYFGLIRDWFDFPMLAEVFGRRADWSLVLIGPRDTDTSSLEHLPNVHLLGPRPYEQLPGYLRGFDVAIIPYRRTEITEAANPLKLLEYLASGRPVVSADLPAVRDYTQCIHTAEGAEGFERAIEAALEDRSPEAAQRRQEAAKQNSWQQRVELVEASLAQYIYPRLQVLPRKTVLHLVAAMNVAGAEKVVLNTAASARSSEFEHRVVSYVRESDGAGSGFLSEADGLGVVIDRIPLMGRSPRPDVQRLRRLIRRHRATIVHTHGYRADVAASLAARREHIQHVITAHGFVGGGARLSRNEALGRFAARRAARVISVSENVTGILRRSGLDERKIVELPNAIDFDRYAQPVAIPFRTEWAVGEKTFLIGTAGRLSSEKAQGSLIEALSLLPETIRSQCHIVIAGDGPLRQELEEQVAQLELTDRIVFAGFVTDMPSFYKALDLFCLPSLTEGLPLTLLEAAASECPVIASRVGAVGSLVSHNENGLLIDPGDSVQLAEAIRAMFQDHEMRNGFALALRESLRPSYHIEDWIKRLHEIYRDVLNG